jgi:hypothetical protein
MGSRCFPYVKETPLGAILLKHRILIGDPVEQKCAGKYGDEWVR